MKMSLKSSPGIERCDPTEAPAGYYAVPKAQAKPADDSNICGACDWRPKCQDPSTDMLTHGHRCMSYPIRADRDGKTYQRNDRASVVFKAL